jgi:hypothetical protein
MPGTIENYDLQIAYVIAFSVLQTRIPPRLAGKINT